MVSQSYIYVIYSIISTEILGVYNNGSEELLEFFLAWPQISPLIHGSVPTVTCPQNSEFARLAFLKSMENIINARNGGGNNAIKRGVGSLAYNAQSFLITPYLDHSLFGYDDKLINIIDR